MINPNNSNVVYAGGVGTFGSSGRTGIFKSIDVGASWALADNGITDVGFGAQPQDDFSMIIDPNNTNTLYAALGTHCGSVYKTTDGAGTWTRGSGLPCDPTVVRLDPFNSSLLYTRSAQGINNSVDGGLNWSNISSFGANSGFFALAIDPFGSNNLYANDNTGVYRSTDSGVNWALSSGALNNVYKALVSDPVRPNTVYAGEDLGIETSAYMTTNGGSTWTNITNGLPDVGVKRLLVPANDSNVLYAGTDAGVYVYGLTDNQPNTLNVPYFSQNDLLWGPTEYNHSIKLGFTNPTMDRWGCAVTSAAMVLKFHNINEFTDETTIDPGSLNNWLKNNNGYLTGKGGSGSYSYFNWPVIGTLTKQLFNVRKANIKLMHKRAYPSSNTTNLLNEDLNEFPDILKASNSQTSSHFVVAKGVSGNTYSINDPEWNHAALASFNSYTQVDRYIPSQTNFSYLVTVVNPGIELLVTDPQNNKTGKYFDNGTLQSVNEINNASYSFQEPISNPNNQNLLEDLGTGVNEFLLPEPPDGEYEIKLSSDKTEIYEINISTFQEDGNDELNKIKGVISSNNDEIIEISYSQNNTSEIKRFVSFQSLIDDINEAKNLKFIKNNGVYNSLLTKVVISQIVNQINKNVSKNFLNSLLNELNAQRGKHITEDAYQILFYDASYLKNHL
ncbi:MAG: hypothetical protein CO135_02535 [Candidatus Levybacteria bacterium CG_4_9_14_3_um_filter_35_16]|nr:MAG: hypothetical protein COW87_04375 [Candidatus Levybacteria bacterium CG22_combo_CG10-13_8_21_14_all_35_11]PJA91225.1 MAG: hypothetical protein CO135_02535 [Candidatus Levybacteria bacterium CG_4_9_14_3_um_filter_35_16]PJC54843.1 MAG: hypothetical protein CO028_00105 [Candidatus Levybacteria bacterium CG_4_9_14_0_2_um_filter_35_21]